MASRRKFLKTAVAAGVAAVAAPDLREPGGITWLGAGAWDPCHFITLKPVRSLDDLKGLRMFTFPTAGRFLARFDVAPVTLSFEEVMPALQSDKLDGVAWSGITEAYAVGWADAANYFLTNNISGAWRGSYFANSDKWNALPAHLKALFQLSSVVSASSFSKRRVRRRGPSFCKIP